MRALALLVFVATAAGAGPAVQSSALAFVGLDENTRQIFLIRSDGGGLRQLTSPPGHHEGPVWSPDGRTLSFVHTDSRGTQIYTLRADGSRKRRLTEPPGSHRAPAWSPDGHWIAYVEDRDARSQMFVMRADGSGKRRLTSPPRSSQAPAWSPDGTRIAYLSRLPGRQAELFVMRANGSDQRLVPTRSTGTIPVVNSAHWLPNGSGLVYTSRAGVAADEIAFVQPDGSGYRWFSTGYAPMLAPDMTQVAYVVSRVGSAQVYTKPFASGSSRPLTPRTWISVRPAWSQDGQWIAYLSVKPGEYLGVWVMRPDGSRQRRLAPAAGNLEVLPLISWRPR